MRAPRRLVCARYRGRPVRTSLLAAGPTFRQKNHLLKIQTFSKWFFQLLSSEWLILDFCNAPLLNVNTQNGDISRVDPTNP